MLTWVCRRGSFREMLLDFCSCIVQGAQNQILDSMGGSTSIASASCKLDPLAAVISGLLLGDAHLPHFLSFLRRLLWRKKVLMRQTKVPICLRNLRYTQVLLFYTSYYSFWNLGYSLRRVLILTIGIKGNKGHSKSRAWWETFQDTKLLIMTRLKSQPICLKKAPFEPLFCPCHVVTYHRSPCRPCHEGCTVFQSDHRSWPAGEGPFDARNYESQVNQLHQWQLFQDSKHSISIFRPPGNSACDFFASSYKRRSIAFLQDPAWYLPVILLFSTLSVLAIFYVQWCYQFVKWE